MLQNLKQHGIRLHLLSGDRQAAVAQVAQELGLDAYRAEATPEDKLAYVENLQKQGRKVMMIGDGINDAPRPCPSRRVCRSGYKCRCGARRCGCGSAQ